MGKEKRYSEELLCAILFVGLGFGVVAGMAIYATAFPIFQSTKWAAWAAAFGTFSAAGAAVYFGLSEQRKSARQRSSTTRFCREAAKKDLHLVSGAVSDILYYVDLVAWQIEQTPNRKLDTDYMRSLYGQILDFAESMEFPTYNSISRWMPEIDEEIASAIVAIDAAIARQHESLKNFLFPLTRDNVSGALGASCCVTGLTRIKPLVNALDVVLSSSPGDGLEPKYVALMDRLGALKDRPDSTDDNPDSFGNPLQAHGLPPQ